MTSLNQWRAEIAETPAPRTRAKFVCTTETHVRWSPNGNFQRSYEFSAVYDMDAPEDQRFCKATPTGNLKITVDNPAVEFIPGKAYYLDFTLAN